MTSCSASPALRPTMSLFMGGAWGKVIAVYIFSLMGIGVLSLWNTLPGKASYGFHAVCRRSFWVAPLPRSQPPWISRALPPWLHVDLLPFGFTLTALAYAYYFFRPRTDMIASIDRNAVVEGMDDGWMVLDSQNIVVDMNSAVERMAGIARQKVLGQPVSTMLGSLPDFGQTFNRSQELEMKRSIKSEDGWKYLNIRISPLNDRRSQTVRAPGPLARCYRAQAHRGCPPKGPRRNAGIAQCHLERGQQRGRSRGFPFRIHLITSYIRFAARSLASSCWTKRPEEGRPGFRTELRTLGCQPTAPRSSRSCRLLPALLLDDQRTSAPAGGGCGSRCNASPLA